MNTFKCILVGDGGVGKTTLISRIVGKPFNEQYDSTLGVEITSINFNTNKNIIHLNIWNCAGQEAFSGLEEEHYLGAHCAIIMFDINNIHNISKWETKIKNIPIIYIGNKNDIHTIDQTNVNINTPYYNISVKNDDIIKLKQPFLKLIQILLKDDNITFV